ncbi:hypothetical protein WN944_000037 [Citrus x changshan-huyou]|uniref:Uncharacterized protein n=1 Tax=Citrus x changshan-huyou TaxID=2935761 RepID=A0AAP0MH44_9ROSI
MSLPEEFMTARKAAIIIFNEPTAFKSYVVTLDAAAKAHLRTHWDGKEQVKGSSSRVLCSANKHSSDQMPSCNRSINATSSEVEATGNQRKKDVLGDEEIGS